MRYGLEWKQVDPNLVKGIPLAILTRGQGVFGWVMTRQGEVWSAMQSPKADLTMRVNPLTDGHLIGVYPNMRTAMDVVEGKVYHMIEQALANVKRNRDGLR